MAQADQSVQNATFPTVRADVNDNLAALFSDSSGNTAPSVTVAFQDWIDTSGANPLWKKRNAANSAWITLGTISASTIAFEGTLPSQSGNANKYLRTDGTIASWESVLSLGSIITAGTFVASTSGTSIDFTSIPSWVKRVTVMFKGVSTSGTSIMQVQVGSGSISTSGYASQAWAGGVGSGVATTGIYLQHNYVASFVLTGALTMRLYSGNQWIADGTLGFVNVTSNGYSCIGTTPALSGTLDRVRITTVNGTDTFDAGSINILYEG